MIVSDLRADRALLKSSLREIGYRRDIFECEDREAALRTIDQSRTQLVICELGLPGLDGLTLLRAMRDKPELKAVPFIMLAERAEAGIVKGAIALGVSGFLIKPFSLGALRQKVEAAIGLF